MDFGALTFLAQTDPVVNAISGSSGWAGAGLLGLVLGWLLFFHLPRKDAQIKELLDLFARERESDRQARKEQSSDFKAVQAQVSEASRQALLAVCTEFRIDSKAEREAYERNIKAERESCERMMAELLNVNARKP